MSSVCLIVNDVHLDYLRCYLPGFFTIKLLFYSLIVNISFMGQYLYLYKYVIPNQTLNLFIPLFISVWTHGFLVDSIQNNMLLLLFWCSSWPNLARGNATKLASIIWTCCLYFLNTFLFWGIIRCSRLIFIFCCFSGPAMKSPISIRNSGFPSNDILYSLSLKCDYSQTVWTNRSKRFYVYVWIQMCIDIQTYIYIQKIYKIYIFKNVCIIQMYK